MKPFDLEKALKGEPVVTRDGRQASEIFSFKSATVASPVRALITGEVFGFERSGSYYLTGESINDLFMAPKVRTVYVNFFTSSSAFYGTSTLSAAFATSELAQQHADRLSAKGYCRVLKVAHPVEIED